MLGNSNQIVFVDKYRLKHVFSELLDNALKFSEKDIEVYYEVADKIIVQVKDFGIGISTKEQQYIFENFTRLESPDRIYRGTGLGLSIANQIIQNHNGTLSVDSEPDKGSVFTVTLPFYD
ncbi:MAG: ATP-binding protein [Bacteroidota bacterium]|nr:ATP-binding protein [Bacteroidota bacterium]